MKNIKNYVFDRYEYYIKLLLYYIYEKLESL
jgi:hypothetical protein